MPRATPARLVHGALLFCSLIAHASAAPADRIVVVLPGQTLVPGTGVTGAPDHASQNRRFVVALYAVDALGNIDFSYEGALNGIAVAGDAPPPGEPPLPAARRFGTSISGESAATAVGAGTLRVSLGGSAFHTISHGPAGTPQAVCGKIADGIEALEPSLFAAGSIDIVCHDAAGRYGIFALVDRSNLSRLLDRDIGRGIAFDPDWGSAPALKLGAGLDPNAPAGPGAPAEYAPRNVEPPAATDMKFSRGMAVFEIAAFHVTGPGMTIQVDQGAGGLPVIASSFDVQPASMRVESAVLTDDDDDGSIETAVLTFSEPIDPLSLPIDPVDFTIARPGMTPLDGTSVEVSAFDGLGYNAGKIAVRFGGGIGKTDVEGVAITYASSVGLLGTKSGTVTVSFSLFDTSADPADVRLIDGAEPVLLGAFAEDTDSNDGLDLMSFIFSEPVAFTAGRGTSFSIPGAPAVDPGSLWFPVPALLRVSLAGLTALEGEVPVVDPSDPNLPFVAGGPALARALTDALRRSGPPIPAWSHAGAGHVHGRYVIRSGTAAASSSAEVLPAEGPDDLAPLLQLGTANGGVERPGHDDGVADLDSIAIRGADGANLLFGVTEAGVSIASNEIIVELTNVPGSGTAAPGWIWRDDGDLGFIADKAPAPNAAAPMNNLGLAPHFNPKELLVEASSTAGPDLVLRRTAQPGPIQLDASGSFLPLTPADDASAMTFTWTQVGGPLVPGGVPPNDGTVFFTPTVAGVYTFELALSVPDATGNAFNAYLDNDRTLGRLLELTVTPGPQDDAIILLPGQSLTPGALSAGEATGGIPRVATVGVPYRIEVVATDAYYNEVEPPPGAMARLATTDPLDIEPPFTAFEGSRARLTLVPSETAATLIPEVDDEVLVAFEQGDVHRPYIVGSLWNVTAASEPGAAGRVKVRFSWPADARATAWNVYRAVLPFPDVDQDGLSDSGYGACIAAIDPDPADALFEDDAEPPPGGIFAYTGTMTMMAFGIEQETSLGTATGIDGILERPNVTPCTDALPAIGRSLRVRLLRF